MRPLRHRRLDQADAGGDAGDGVVDRASEVPFIGVARRDVGPAWKTFCPRPESYTWYVQYVWSRYQANICLFSPIHNDIAGDTIPDDVGYSNPVWFRRRSQFLQSVMPA
jgi:hypothetical protein